MHQLQLNILGGFALLRGGRELSVGGAKQKALLAYLALQDGQPVARKFFADLLWGDSFEQQARRSLRQALFRLKKNLADADILILRDDTIALAMDKLSVDALVFQATAQAQAVEVTDPAAAAPQYHQLLEGLSLPNASFEEWLTQERDRLIEFSGAAYDRFSAAHMADQPKAALAAAEAWIALDTLNEAAHRRAIEIELAQGDRVAALRRFKALNETLGRELGIEPGAETKVLAAAAFIRFVISASLLAVFCSD